MRGLYLIGWLLALSAGFGLGIFIAWYVVPVSYTDAQPWDLSSGAKDDYLRMIASSYAVDNDFRAAGRRVYYLQLADPQARLGDLARTDTNVKTQQALIKLLLGLRQPAAALVLPTYTPRSIRNPSPAARVTVIVVEPTTDPPTLPLATDEPTPLPPTSEPNPAAPRFELVRKEALDCQAVGGGAALVVQVQDFGGRGVPGVAIEVNSERGNEVFYTGLKPERGAGLADLEVLPGNYSLHLVQNAQSPIIGDLRIDSNDVECTGTPAATQGWHLVFRQVE
jgi:hypothetical protein